MRATGMRVEFIDRLRGYRFADELRRSGPHTDVRVWHSNARVVVNLPTARATDANLALLEESGGIMQPTRRSERALPT